MKVLAAALMAAVLAGSPAPARAPDQVQLRILPLAWDDHAGWIMIWQRDLHLLIHLAGRHCADL